MCFQTIMALYKKVIAFRHKWQLWPVSQSQSTSALSVVYAAVCWVTDIWPVLIEDKLPKDRRAQPVEIDLKLECQHLSLAVCPAQSFRWKQPSKGRLYVFDPPLERWPLEIDIRCCWSTHDGRSESNTKWIHTALQTIYKSNCLQLQSRFTVKE